VGVFLCAFVRAWVRALVLAFACVCVRACVRVCMQMFACACVRVCMCVCSCVSVFLLRFLVVHLATQGAFAEKE
jgi:hypothetical protein